MGGGGWVSVATEAVALLGHGCSEGKIDNVRLMMFGGGVVYCEDECVYDLLSLALVG